LSHSAVVVQRLKGSQEGGGGGVVAEGFAEVDETVDISGQKDKAAAELEGVWAKFVLMMAGGACTIASLEIIWAGEVKQIGGSQSGDDVGLAMLVDQQGKGDSRFFTEKAGIVAVAQTDGGEGGAFVEEGLLVFAQLRDVLVAEDSAVVAKKDDDGGIVFPKRAETDFLTVRIWENDIGESLAESFVHVKLSSTSLRSTVKAELLLEQDGDSEASHSLTRAKFR
jgi:hypothetical protein